MADIVCLLISHIDDHDFILLHQVFKLGSRDATHAVVRLLLLLSSARRSWGTCDDSLDVHVAVIRIAGGERYCYDKDDSFHKYGLCLWYGLCHKRRQRRHNSRRWNTKYRTRRVS